MVKVCKSRKYGLDLRPDESICNEECQLGSARRAERQATRFDVAKKLKAQGVGIDTIVKATNLSVREINCIDELERIRKLARHNEASAIGHAKRVVRKESFIEIATELKEQGVSMEDIIRATDLTIEEILRL